MVNAYNSSTILEFYKQLSNNFPKLKQNAMRITSYFATTYRCEQLFSSLALIKNNKSNRVPQTILEARLRLISAGDINPDFNKIMQFHQYQPSHWSDKVCASIDLKCETGGLTET